MGLRKKISADVIRKAADTLKAISHPERLQIIECLARKEEMTVSDLIEEIHVDQATASKHLTFLKSKGIVKNKAEANFRHYSIALPSVISILDCIQRHQG